MAGFGSSTRTQRGLGAWLRPAALACALALTPVPALADNAGKPMTFEWSTTFGDTQAIFGDGDFTPQTPAALRAFLARSTYTLHTPIPPRETGIDEIVKIAMCSIGVAWM